MTPRSTASGAGGQGGEARLAGRWAGGRRSCRGWGGRTSLHSPERALQHASGSGAQAARAAQPQLARAARKHCAPPSPVLVSMTTAGQRRSQAICQNASRVCFSGPCAARYAQRSPPPPPSSGDALM